MRLWTLTVCAALGGCELENTLLFDRAQTDVYTFPDNRVPGVEELDLVTGDGVRIAAALAPRESPRAVVLLLHGRGGNIDDVWDRVMTLWDRNLAVFAIDYRGYGRSDGEPSESGLYEDGRTAMRWLEAEDAGPVWIWGISLGTAVASQLATEFSAEAVVLDAPFTSMRDMVEQSTPFSLPRDWVIESDWDTLSRIGRCRSPLVVAHGTEDGTVPPEMGERVFNAAPEPKALVRAEGAGHNTVILDHADEVLAAVERVLNGGVNP
ncbi:MAG: alpha/beta fold hydrolase [Myxococcota bacterium]